MSAAWRVCGLAGSASGPCRPVHRRLASPSSVKTMLRHSALTWLHLPQAQHPSPVPPTKLNKTEGDALPCVGGQAVPLRPRRRTSEAAQRLRGPLTSPVRRPRSRRGTRCPRGPPSPGAPPLHAPPGGGTRPPAGPEAGRGSVTVSPRLEVLPADSARSDHPSLRGPREARALSWGCSACEGRGHAGLLAPSCPVAAWNMPAQTRGLRPAHLRGTRRPPLGLGCRPPWQRPTHRRATPAIYHGLI